MKTSFIQIIAACGLALAAASAQAQLTNGNFGAGLAGWNPLGDTSVQAGTLTLTTAYASGDDAPFNLSGNNAVWIDMLEAAAGVVPYALDLSEQPAYEGSLVRQSFAVAAGDTLSFSWSFSTQETLFLDHAFVVLSGNVTTLASTATAPAGLQSFSTTFAQAGNVTLSFGVVDTGDFNGVSALNISNVAITAVPEPGTVALMLAGLALLGRRAAQARWL